MTAPDQASRDAARDLATEFEREMVLAGLWADTTEYNALRRRGEILAILEAVAARIIHAPRGSHAEARERR